MKLRLVCFAIVGALSLTSCSNTPSPTKTAAPSQVAVTPSASPAPTAVGRVPVSCESTPMVAALNAQLAGATFIDTPWQPAKGTDLEAVLSKGGIACSFGIQSAEIGISALWVKTDLATFESRSVAWLKQGYRAKTIPGLNVERAYFLYKAQSPTQEFHVWIVNFYYEGFWLQLGSSFGATLEDNLFLLKAAIAALSPPNNSDQVTGCYVGELAKDKYILNITSQKNYAITAKIAFLNAQKDQSKGAFLGTYYDGLLLGVYTFKSEGVWSKSELVFKRDGDGFIAGYGPAQMTGDISWMTRPLALKWETAYRFNRATDCAIP